MHREVVYRSRLLRVPGFVLAWWWNAWQRVSVALAQALLFGRVCGDEKRVAVYRIGSIGDFVHALPALAAIRRRHPDAAITLVTNAVGGESWPERLGLDSVFKLSVTNYSSGTELRQGVRAADCLYYLAPHPLGFWRAIRDVLFFRSCGLGRATGFRALTPRGCAARALRPWREAEPQHQRLLRACRLEAPAERVALPHREGQRPTGPYAVFAATGKSTAQHWPDARFRVLAGKLDARGLRPVWVGDEADATRLGKGLIGVTMFGALDFAQLTGLLAGAAVVVANDSGLAHLAAWAGAPLVVVSPARAAAGAWHPPGERVTVLRKDMNCEACHLRECTDTACLQLISVDEVYAAVEKHLS